MLYCVYTVNEIQRFHRQPKQNTTTVVKTFTCKTDAIETLERLHTHMCENNPWYKVAAHAIFDEDGEDQLLRYSGDNDASGLSIELRIEKLELAKPIKTYEPVTLPSITDEINDNLEHVLGNGGTREVLIESVLQRAGFEYVLNRLLIDPPSRKAILERALLDNGGVTFRNLLIKDECAREVLIDRMQEGLGLGEITAQFLLDPGHREELLQSMFNQSPENIRECIVVEALENQEVLKVISTQLVRKLGAKSLAADIIKDSYARTELLELLTFGDARLKTVHETLDDHTARDELVQKLLDDNYDGSVTRAVIHHKEARKDLVEKLYLDKADAGGCCTVSALRGDFKVADALTDLKNEIAGMYLSFITRSEFVLPLHASRQCLLSRCAKYLSLTE